MKKFSRIIIIAIVIALALSICSCSTIRDITRVPKFSKKLMAIAEVRDPEQALAQAESIVHPSSPLNNTSIIEKIKADEDLKDLDLESLASQNYSIGSFSDIELKFNDPDLGGNIYETKVEVRFGDQVFVVIITILSDSDTMGLYDFDISK